MTTENTAAPTVTSPEAETSSSPAYDFLQAILFKDVVALRRYGVDDKTAGAIDLKAQIAVAEKLLSSDNNHKRSQSKRVLAAQAGLITTSDNNKPASTVTPSPVAQFTTRVPTLKAAS
jgi:hypothetical protein